MMDTSDILVEQLRRTREWLHMVLSGFEAEDWTYQPATGLQHALWICGHLATAQDTLVFQRCLGKSILSEGFRRHFPIGAPIKSAGEYPWPATEDVPRKMEEMQAATLKAVAGMSDALLAEPAAGKNGAPHPHYATKLGAISHLDRHEAFHTGQVATIRRLLGKPFLR